MLPAETTPVLAPDVLRSAATLTATAAELVELGVARGTPRTADWEATNLLTVAATLVAAAYAARRPGAATGGRTSRWPTSGGTATWSVPSVERDG